MISTSWGRVSAVLEQAMILPAGEREDFLRRACGDDGELLGRVRRLLALDEREHALLDEGHSGFLDAMLSAALPPPPKVPPDLTSWRVGPYRLERELGRGGMGVVYLARRDDLQSRVALKLLLHGSASVLGAEWFRREQQVHAQLEHPNIARLLDAGVADDGTPWMVMEYVDGAPIDRHCRDRQLDLAGRLALFQQVADAVAHAHRNLVVHRDIKPSNILVTADGVPKLVDFGIAKVLASNTLGARLGGTTAAGVLTMACAAPEQLRSEAVTTATDVYQLGLLLHELLTGRPVANSAGAPLDPIARAADQVPARPSSLVDSRARRALEGDLDSIVLKAIRPEPQDRYPSAAQMLEDVRRYREGLPVLARRGTLGYRVGKLIRRNRAASALFITVVALTLAGLLALMMQSAHVARERDRANQFSQLLEGLVAGADPLAARDSLSARVVLERTAREARRRVASEPAVWGRLLAVVGRTYLNLGDLDEAVVTARDLQAALASVPGSHEVLHASAEGTLGAALARQGNTAEGLRWLSSALTHLEGSAHAMDRGLLLGELARAHGLAGHLDSATSRYHEALAVLATLPDSGGAEYDRLTVDLGNHVLQAGRLAQAKELLSGAVARLTARDGALSGVALFARAELADILLKEGDIPAALAMSAEVLDARRRLGGGPHEHLAGALLQHARALSRDGQHDAALAAMREAIGIWSELHGPASPSVAYAKVQQAAMHRHAGNLRDAATLEGEALAIFTTVNGPESDGARYTAARLARTEYLLGWLDASERRFRQVIPGLDTTAAARGRVLTPLTDYAELLVATGRCAEAAVPLARAEEIAREMLPAGHAARVRVETLVGRCERREARAE